MKRRKEKWANCKEKRGRGDKMQREGREVGQTIKRREGSGVNYKEKGDNAGKLQR